jgi:hypothetical protein
VATVLRLDERHRYSSCVEQIYENIFCTSRQHSQQQTDPNFERKIVPEQQKHFEPKVFLRQQERNQQRLRDSK